MSGTTRNAKIDVGDVERRYKKLYAPHVDSFNWFLETGARLVVEDLRPQSFELPDAQTCTMWVEDVRFNTPHRITPEQRLMPSECRVAGTTYGSETLATIGYQVGEKISHTKFSLGRLPVMVRSNMCSLHRSVMRKGDKVTTPRERMERLIDSGEEPFEQGGFFIVNGIEKMNRMVNLARRNYPHAYIREAYEQSGPLFTSYVVQMRSARKDHTGTTINLHYLRSGDITIRFVINGVSFFIPAAMLLKAWKSSTDLEIYHAIVQADDQDTWLTDRVECLLRAVPHQNPEDGPPHSSVTVLRHIGRIFKEHLAHPPHYSLLDLGKMVLENNILIHLDNPEDKFNCMVFMVRKLYALVAGKIKPDNADSVCNAEVLMPGHLYAMVFKEKLGSWLLNVKGAIINDVRARQRRAELIERRQSLLATAPGEAAAADSDPDDVDQDKPKIRVPRPVPPKEDAKQRFNANTKAKQQDPLAVPSVEAYLLDMMRKTNSVAKRMEYFLATGNVKPQVGRDVRQTSGFSIVAERLNLLRYTSHYRAVHRGQAYQEMKTTSVRKLLPDSWGFVCPVHTPDGGPCGLLNHLSASCELSLDPDMNLDLFMKVLNMLGLVSVSAAQKLSDHLAVYLDGKVLGYIAAAHSEEVVHILRALKILGNEGKHLLKGRVDIKDIRQVIPYNLEIVLVKDMSVGIFPALYLYAGPARMIRPVVNLKWNRVEYIGTWEQPFFHIDIPLIARYRPNAEFVKTETEEPFTHREISSTAFLSLVASLTPFSDFNQSPRNMYQCQMGKQTMGMSPHALIRRADNKIYRILTPQSPVCRTANQDRYQIDQYATGTNAVVAVLAYTGYDMEDAMVINKGAYERGIGWGYVYKSVTIDLTDKTDKSEGKIAYFCNLDPSTNSEYEKSLDTDGLPQPGDILRTGDPYYVYYNEAKQKFFVELYKGDEAIVDAVLLIVANSDQSEMTAMQKVMFKLRIKRFPIRGDKFSSRHGQKGVMSRLYPTIDMPFTDSGITPDVIINPNAFPSRMTIGMLVEIMAGKSGSLHGTFYDASPFNFDDKLTPIQYFGNQLLKSGYNYYGNEQLYNGFTGEPLYADIFIGVCYYQRLRHMVGDKYQVRAGEGGSVATTGQPIKGRKVGGGIRFGEMERDSILAHGLAYTLKDRLLNSSDEWMTRVCGKCGSILTIWPTEGNQNRGGWSLSANRPRSEDMDVDSPFGAAMATTSEKHYDHCHTCGPIATARDIKTLIIPQVFHYLVTELVSCNIRVSIQT